MRGASDPSERQKGEDPAHLLGEKIPKSGVMPDKALSWILPDGILNAPSLLTGWEGPMQWEEEGSAGSLAHAEGSKGHHQHLALDPEANRRPLPVSPLVVKIACAATFCTS